MTFTETPGTAALLVSWITPVMLPRSDCAKHGAAIANARAASAIAVKCRITMGLLPWDGLCLEPPALAPIPGTEVPSDLRPRIVAEYIRGRRSRGTSVPAHARHRIP